VLELGFGYLGSLNLTDLAQPCSKNSRARATRAARWRCWTASRSSTSQRVPGRRIMSVTLGVGARLPAFSASMGRVLLSAWTKPRSTTWLPQCAPAKLPRTP
jgi:IclR family pca regulon transcriptional regulator